MCDEKSTKLLALSAALILSGVVISVVSLGGQVHAQGTQVDVEKLKQILNETRTVIEANDDPGPLTQVDLADEVLSGDSNISASSNMTNTTAIVTS